MSESGLSIGFPDLQSQVGFFLGYGATIGNYSAAQLLEISGLIQSGVRRVYYPPAISANIVGYEWSWLRPTKTLSVVSGTADYNLPDDFGRLIDTIHFPADVHRNSLAIISVSKMLDFRARRSISQAPRYAAIRYKASDGTIGQRQELLLYPNPNENWTMLYEYEAYSGALSDAHPYPLGGMQLSEVYIESCLALAESRVNDEVGIHNQQFSALLVDAIARDRKNGAQLYGQMGHNEGRGWRRFRRGYTGDVYPIQNFQEGHYGDYI